MRSFFYNLDKLDYECDLNHNKDLKNFCAEVREFIKRGSFTGYKKANILLMHWGSPDCTVSKLTGIKESTVRQGRRKMSNDLYELFGYDFFEIVGVGDAKAIREGKYRLDLARMGFDSNNFLYHELKLAIQSDASVVDDIDISTCKAEIHFLVKHSKQSISRELACLDKNKLLYLIRMLNNETGSSMNIRNLIRCFEEGV